MVATWTGVEQQRFGLVLRAFAQQTGAVVRYTPARHDVARVLAARLAAGDPPDVAVVSQPGLLRDLASAGRLVPLDAGTRALVDGRVAPELARLASYRGRLFGVWFKAANKSLLWYDEAAFERLGAVPPTDLPGLLAVARRFAAAGVPAFAVAADDQAGSLGAVPVVAATAWATGRRPLAGQLLREGGAAWLSAKALKAVVRRPRPGTLLPATRRRGPDASGLGYVSGHAAVVVALTATALPQLPPRGRSVVLAVAPAVCLARLYVGAHLPLDVAGGAALGLALEGLAGLRTRTSGTHSPHTCPD